VEAGNKPLETADVVREEANLLQSQGASPSFSALCISGGGIRSATFGLGAIQGLAERGLLEQFDYLSTVSGGGYIGSWLTMWATRAGGVDKIVPKLKADGCMSERDPIGHLREYNSYLSPTVGAVSSDLWTLVATVLRNVLLNWLVLVPLLLAVLTIPRAYLAILTLPERLFGAAVFAGPTPDYSAPALDAVSGSPLVWLVLPVAALLLLAITFFNMVRYLPGIGGKPHTRFDYLVWVEGPLVSAVLTYLLYDSLYYVGHAFVDETPVASQMLWTMVACGAGWIAYLAYDKRPRQERMKLLFGWLTVTIAAGAATAGAATWVITNVVLWNVNASLAASWATYVTFGPPLILAGLLLGTILTSGLASNVLKDEDREWLARGNAGLLLAAVGWLALCLVVLELPKWVLAWRTWGAGVLSVGGGIAAWLSRAEPPAPANANPGAGAARPNRVLAMAASAAPLVFVTLLAIALSIATNMLIGGEHGVVGAPLSGPHGEPVGWRQHQAVLERSSVAAIALLAFAFIATSWFMARYVNINTFSLHGMYRDRLIRAYLGASNPTRHPNPFTGFDRDDDAPLARLRGTRPFHVVNVTLNLVQTTRLAWQQRKAASFTMTPLHCGSADLGYRDSSGYGGGISVGTAVAISGAAASPNMGYHSSPLVGFIMTLFNARLGSWLGNPGKAGARAWKDAGPRSAIGSLVKEALGRTSESSKYVYLSDGGHFENLGLYEMIRRRCRFIVVLDSGCDPQFTFEDLGNALRKIRIDFGVSIDLDAAQVRAVGARERRYAVGTIAYSAVDANVADGVLLYIKPMLLGTEPPDVRSYAAGHPDFPHQSTSDQWFDESQTESYRRLGLQTVREVCGDWMEGLLPELLLRLRAEAAPGGPDVQLRANAGAPAPSSL
jgi:patatin-like phospholipase